MIYIFRSDRIFSVYIYVPGLGGEAVGGAAGGGVEGGVQQPRLLQLRPARPPAAGRRRAGVRARGRLVQPAACVRCARINVPGAEAGHVRPRDTGHGYSKVTFHSSGWKQMYLLCGNLYNIVFSSVIQLN